MEPRVSSTFTEELLTETVNHLPSIAHPTGLQMILVFLLIRVKNMLDSSPHFETSIVDYGATVGNRYDFNGWNTDLSVTLGSNSVDYTHR